MPRANKVKMRTKGRRIQIQIDAVSSQQAKLVYNAIEKYLLESLQTDLEAQLNLKSTEPLAFYPELELN